LIFGIATDRDKSYPGKFLSLLRLGGEANREEHGGKRKTNDFLSHRVFPCFYRSPALCSLLHTISACLLLFIDSCPGYFLPCF
jgi:hypothetical protein